MADLEQLSRLRQGVERWNRWREKNPGIQVRLVGANLRGANLRGANLKGANLEGAGLKGANLEGAGLKGANLKNAHLLATNLIGAKLTDAVFTNATLVHAKFGGSDLTQVSGLQTIRHIAPSMIGYGVLERTAAGLQERPAKRESVEIFYRGIGLEDWEIEAAKLHEPGLTTDEVHDITYRISNLKTETPININPIFISYTHKDSGFVEALESKLKEKRIRYWRDVHDMKAGPLEEQVERAIEINPTFILVLSGNSVESDWVEWEAKKAREIEKKLRRNGAARHVLCPVRLDDAWKGADWSGRLRQQIEKYYMVDFSNWQDGAAFEESFERLLEGLGIYYPLSQAAGSGSG